jgi:hypothetical protein
LKEVDNLGIRTSRKIREEDGSGNGLGVDFEMVEEDTEGNKGSLNRGMPPGYRKGSIEEMNEKKV